MLKIFSKKNNNPPIDHEADYPSWNNGFIVCESCRKQIYFNGLEPLSFSLCPFCNTNNYIPMLIDHYWMYEPLGGGGMGSVYKSISFRDNSTFAIKILQRKEKKNRYIVNTLIREGQIATKISSHPNIGSVFECGNIKDEYFIVSEFLEGSRLDRCITDNDNIPEEKILSWGLQLLSALQHIYNCGYLYRDLKPQNLIVSTNGRDIKIIDFGLTIEISKSGVNDGDSIEGSPQYFPPERCNFEEENMFSEIYSLGMVLFYCFTGEPYYSSDSIMGLLQQHVRRLRVRSVAARLPDINPDIVKILDKMIKRDPAKRYQTYQTAYEDIKKIYDMYRYC